MDKTVFISSTFEDLKNHRRKIWDLLEKYDVNVRGMERFGARKESPLITCLSEVEQSDIFVAIIGFRLGSIDEASGKSFTQREYERAYELNREILIYMMDEKDSKVSPEDIDFGEMREKLVAFKSILKERHTVDHFVSEDDLVEKIKRKFQDLLACKTEPEDASQDDYANSQKLIERFLLLPRTYSGREVKLEVDFVDQPFPASKSICSSFNLEYGGTMGVRVKIKKPAIKADGIEYVLIDEENVDDYFSLQQKNNIQIFATLKFSANVVEDKRAHFVRQVYFTGGSITTTSVFTSAISPLERTTIEADGTIIIKLKEILQR